MSDAATAGAESWARKRLNGINTTELGGAGRENADWLFSAVDDLDGKHYIAGVALDGKSRFMIEVPERCHGGCLRPSSHQAVLFARRPGTRMHVIDGANRRLAHTISAGEGYHFYGHGVFDLNGRYLYVTANRLADSAGLVRVYDAANDYAHVRDMSLDGIGPHELRLMPDGDTLVIGLGGIQTDPDSTVGLSSIWTLWPRR